MGYSSPGKTWSIIRGQIVFTLKEIKFATELILMFMSFWIMTIPLSFLSLDAVSLISRYGPLLMIWSWTKIKQRFFTLHLSSENHLHYLLSILSVFQESLWSMSVKELLLHMISQWIFTSIINAALPPTLCTQSVALETLWMEKTIATLVHAFITCRLDQCSSLLYGLSLAGHKLSCISKTKHRMNLP